MRFLSVLLLFCFATSLVIGSEPSGFGAKWANVFKSFFGHENPQVPVQSDSAEDSVHARLKRAVYAAMGWTVTCNSGWTGTYCQTPVCPLEPQPLFRTVIGDKLVDRVDLGSGCSQSYVFPIEANVFYLTLNVNTQYGRPQVVLLDDNNFQVDIGGVSQEGYGVFTLNHPRPGMYSLSVNLTNAQTTSYCGVTVEVSAALDVTAGFVATPQTDQVEYQLLYANNPSFFVAHLANSTAPGSLGAVYIRSNKQSTFDYTSPLSSRYSCNYEYYAGYFTCQSGPTYQWIVDGIDGYGYRFRRADDFHCLLQPTTQGPSTTTATPPSACLNGGTLVNTTGAAFCYCGTFFTGPTCAQRVCMHNGNLAPDGLSCVCQPGYTGPFCEHISCSTDVLGGFNTDEKTLIVVVRQSPFIATQINDIAKAINDHILYHFEETLYTSFVLVTFSNDKINWNEYSTSTDFLTDLTKLNTTNVQTGCNDTVIDAIAAVFNVEVINAKSPILVITDAPPDDSADYLTVVHRNTFRKLPIFVLYLNNPSGGCNVDQMSAGYRALQMVSHSTGGLVMTPTINNLPNAVKYTLRFVTYHSNLVLGYDYFQCSMGNHGSFFVDTSVKTIAILATGLNLTITVTDPNGNSSMIIDGLVADNGNYIWHIAGDVIAGEYLFFITSAGGSTQPCNYRVFVQSNYDLFYGVSNSLTTDAYFTEPIYRQSSNMVATFNGLRGQVRDQFRLFAEMQISRYNRSGALEPVYYSNGVYRDGCNYHLSFGSFVCNIPNEHLYMTVFADDPFGFPIQRTAVIYCAYEQPTEAPPFSCINGGVTNPRNTTTCLCPAHWTGQYCQNIVCENNGTAVANTYCQCPEFTAGRFCEETSCGQPATGVNFLFTHRSLALVLNIQFSMNASLHDLANNIQDFVRDLFIMHNLFITKFVVITYNENTTTIYKVTEDPRGFIAAVHFAAEQAAIAANSSCRTGLLDSAIQLAIDESLPQSFIFAFTDAESSEDPNGNSPLAMNMINAQDSKININLVAVSNSICGGVNGYQFIPQHIEMVGFTEGEVFYTTHPGKFMSYIPTLYKSGVFSGGNSNNCNITRFLPVDYWSQAFTVYTGGNNVTVKVTPPSGSSADFENIIDQDMYLDIRQYIIPCDTTNGYWSPAGQYCYNFNTVSLNYSSAVDHCHMVSNGHLIHIFSQDTQNAVNTKIGQATLWLGLKRMGSTWVWDTPGFGQLNLTLTGYTNWDNTTNPNDPSKGDCVILKPGTGGTPRWFVVQCTDVYLTMCQKHRYNQEFEPGKNTNLLPAGLWRIDVTGQGPCGMEARIQSEVQVFYGFTTDLHSDDPQTFANLQSDQNRVIAHTTGLEPINPDANKDSVDGNLNYAYMYVNSTLIRVARFQPRARCAYRAVSQTFKCPQYGTSATLTEMPIKFSGIDQYGNLFERIGTPYCAKTIMSCLNEGYLYNGFCICKENFEGSRCQTRICRNGGVLEPNGQCRCPEETTGESCETFMCVPPRKADFSQNNKTLAIVFETSYAMTVTQLLLGKRFTSIIQQVISQTSHTWFTNFILYPFDSTSNQGMWYNKVHTNNPADIQTALSSFPTYQCPGGSPCESGIKCPRPILSVINDTLNDPSFASGSIILLFTQSTIEDITKHNSVYANIQNKRAQIHIILPDVSSPCALPWTDASNRVLFTLPEISGGNLFTLLSRDVTKTLLPTYLPTLYNGDVVDSLTIRNCTYDEIYVSVDSQTSEFTVVYSGLSPTVTITDPANVTTQLPPNLLNSVFNYFAVYKVPKGRAGTYKITAQSNSPAGACLINIHATSTISVFAAYTVPQDAYNGATSDDAHATAVSGRSVQNVVILHATNLNGGYINYVQMYTTQNFGRPQLWTAEVKARSTNCSYEWYSVGGFTCDVEGTYQLAVYGVDGMGYNFRRSIPVDCVSNRPPRDPTPPTCGLYNRFYDIVLVIDGSTAGGFQQLKTIASNAFSPYAFNFQLTRLSIIVVNANATLQGYLKDSDGKQGPQIVAGAVSTNSTGQDLDGALQLIISEFQNPDTSGYRADARHLIVYLTHNAAFSSDPQNTLNSIKRGGMFGFIGIGYELNNNDATSLTNLGGDRCTYNGYGPTAQTLIPYFIQDITCFRFPVCGE